MSRCELCFHRCELNEGQQGLCRARSCKNGTVVSDTYGLISSVALDPIEKKPLRNFWPGKRVLSVGSWGCNLRCPFCQNSSISMTDGRGQKCLRITPDQLARKAWELAAQGNIGVAYTYNEPTVGYEFVSDCAERVQVLGLKNVLVTNGSLLRRPLEALLPKIDAMNVDLKSMNEDTYRWLGGDLATVKNFIETVAESPCHLEVTTLLVPGKNDSADEVEQIAMWLASLDRDIPLHLSRYFPSFNCHQPPAPAETVYRLAEIARRHLRFVYEGNC